MSKPTNPGWYWWKEGKALAWEVVYVRSDLGFLATSTMEILYVFEASDDWGPELTPPDKAAEALEYHKNSLTPGGVRKGG